MRSDPNDHPTATCACGSRMEMGQYVCGDCYDKHQRVQSQEIPRLAPKFELVAKPRHKPPQDHQGRDNAGLTLCDGCQMFVECRECIIEGRVLACEWAAVSDVAEIGKGG